MSIGHERLTNEPVGFGLVGERHIKKAQTVSYSPNVSRVSIAIWRSSSSTESQSATTALMLSTAWKHMKRVGNTESNQRSHELVGILKKKDKTFTQVNYFGITVTHLQLQLIVISRAKA